MQEDGTFVNLAGTYNVKIQCKIFTKERKFLTINFHFATHVSIQQNALTICMACYKGENSYCMISYSGCYLKCL